ncbi:hypothetical protein P168DRAFT_325388 [Aspergillus campestris IBT 28561]|uniref:rRNA-processing protein EFG1 n=1 Tax=Aspergillus campestris (strain IBT 28561) TaxID=1392248 RepID=A0A2I1D9I3_ASPC2|nr:uncharacterized protein P168DRAFT_325388 [Aspergillus campestris IBT 28561]PKY06530.1 hypothetical protein P168DRAFT_325388 [Aspergillus campestris IBT 28561]
MPRDRSRSQSPDTSSRPYRDRSDPPKRKYHRDGDAAEQHHSRKKLQLPKKDHKYPSVNELKKRIRDAKRLLNKPDLPVEARIVQERALKGYEQDLEDETKRRERSAMIKKYHFVRFLDRKTATKDIKSLQAQQKTLTESSNPTAAAALEQELYIAQVNLNYTIYYPLAEKYIALYATQQKKKKSADDDDTSKTVYKPVHATAAEKPPMWHVVEKCMKEGTLDRLREGKLGADGSSARVEKEGRKEKETKARKEKSGGGASGKAADRAGSRRRDVPVPVVPEEQDEESDGGFFE